MKSLNRGILISIEGIDGSGKSTLITTLADTLKQHKLPVITTKEPGGTQLGKQLRTILQERTYTLHAKAEFLLFAADRAQHFQEFIIPTLKTNTIIISDRMADSSLVYQGFGRGLDMNTLALVNRWAMQETKPDVTLYVKIPPSVAYERLAKRKNLSVFDQEKAEFFNTIAQGFDTLFANQANVITLDGTQSAEQVATQAVDGVIQWLTQNRM